MNTIFDSQQHKPDTQSPDYIPDLTAEERKQLQRDTAEKLNMSVSFHDEFIAPADISGPELCIIPAGIAMMGSDANEHGHHPNESPKHYITLNKPFAMGKYTITAKEFEYFIQETQWPINPDLIWNKGQKPVINIRASDAKTYLKWLSEKTGQHYRLPTEAEWEYCCRAGTQTPFSLGDEVSCKDIHFDPNFPYNESKEKKWWFLPRCLPSISAMEVGCKEANLWGLHDMHGNVWELTQSHWTHSYANANRDGSTHMQVASQWYATRGGSWFDPAVKARSAARMKRLNDEMDTNLGFRVVRDIA